MLIKIIINIASLLLVCNAMKGQSVGVGTTTPHNSALLDVVSNNRGIAVPRMSTAQRMAIVTPAKGLLVYDTNINALYQFNGSAWVTVGNNNGGGLTLPYANTSASTGALLSVSNSGSASAIFGSTQSSASVALEGTATGTGGYGLNGNNTGSTAYGVAGIATDNTGVSGTSTGTGVALRANSPSGYALVTSGKLKLGGNSLGPSKDLVLTSIDANGNAKWQASKLEKIAFAMEDPASQYNSYPSGQSTKVHFDSRAYDLGLNAQATPFQSTPSPLQSTFTVPVTGVYAFNFNLYASIGTQGFWDYIGAEIKVDRGGIVSTLFTSEQYFTPAQNSRFVLRGACQKRLLAGDIVYMEFKQVNNNAVPVDFLYGYGRTVFSGRLVSAE